MMASQIGRLLHHMDSMFTLGMNRYRLHRPCIDAVSYFIVDVNTAASLDNGVAYLNQTDTNQKR